MNRTTQTKALQNIEVFFESNIDIRDFAQQIRRANHILCEVMMQPNFKDKIAKEHWIQDCFFYLNEFAELIDPFLENEEKPAPMKNGNKL